VRCSAHRCAIRIKNSEARVAITPAGVKALVENDHQVLIQKDAGALSGIRDEEYASVGAKIVPDANTAWSESEMVLKVKEPIQSEYKYLRDDLTLFTFLHLAAERALTDALLSAGTTAIAYETVQVGRQLPLLAPMSEVAGRLAPQMGASTLQKITVDLEFCWVASLAPARQKLSCWVVVSVVPVPSKLP